MAIYLAYGRKHSVCNTGNSNGSEQKFCYSPNVLLSPENKNKIVVPESTSI